MLTARPARPAALLLGALLVFALGGCQSPQERLGELAGQHHRLQTLDSKPFPLLLGAPVQAPAAARLRVYLEGDGQAWATPSQPSLDPSPSDLLVARLAFSDPTPSLYLARPCQFVTAPGCTTSLWTSRRFGSEVLGSLDGALDLIKARYGNRDFELVGYSGGAALALLLAARRDDVASVQTLAGNLSPRYWVQLQHLSSLDGSLDPLDHRQRLVLIPQRHLTGAVDEIVPAAVADHYLNGLGTAPCVEIVSLAGVNHHSGWENAWAQWRQSPLKCVPSMRP
ncbi:alpha/beta hydrolase [Pseudomonas sp. CNPSo 3701]|uniref:alpha/beta hydrolase n=1 Tax=Pseudomonas sp. CNPSo 3701 TaxID=3027943 RepID=UPI002363AE94|nr:alpha/beta hydrolase [Pseudomonas sp. CNPSo 3701]MDD1506172.1 alpha/beta hydrolase [Pseudomonas sp. CNPSo 3701]